MITRTIAFPEELYGTIALFANEKNFSITHAICYLAAKALGKDISHLKFKDPKVKERKENLAWFTLMARTIYDLPYPSNMQDLFNEPFRTFDVYNSLLQTKKWPTGIDKTKDELDVITSLMKNHAIW